MEKLDISRQMLASCKDQMTSCERKRGLLVKLLTDALRTQASAKAPQGQRGLGVCFKAPLNDWGVGKFCGAIIVSRGRMLAGVKEMRDRERTVQVMCVAIFQPCF